MKPEEAIKNVTAYVYMEAENLPSMVVKALDLMKDATKKQIPMKPKARLMVNECPECGTIVGDAYVTCKCCPNCGQAIDWSEQNET